MKRFFKNHGLFCMVLAACLFFTGLCVHIQRHGTLFGKKNSLTRILKRGRIRMITDNNASSYYIYREEAMGYEYDLASAFAQYLNVELEVVTPGWSNLFPYLGRRWGDFIAAGLTITEERKKQAAFSIPYMEVRQHLIHHKLKFGLDSLEDLSGKTIHIRQGTSYQERLEELQKSGINVNIILHDDLPTEELIRMVEDNEIKYTIADSNIAKLNRRYFPDIVIGLPVQEPEHLGWCVKKEDKALLAAINRFMTHAEQTGLKQTIYDRYYGSMAAFDYFDIKKFHERITTRLPEYREFIISESKKYNFDWCIIAAVIYQESHWNPRAQSITGVRGLMQVTRNTAREMGIDNRLDPFQSLNAGIRYMNKLYNRFTDIPLPRDRLLFTLASYNIGYGHIRDAQKIAQAKGLDITRWSSLREALPLLTRRQYYKNTQYGYARGWEPVHYVERILTYYDILKQKETKETNRERNR